MPLDEISKTSDSKSITLRLVSDTYYFEGQSYDNIKAELYVSASADTDTSFKGKLLAQKTRLTLTRNATELPSVKIQTEKRLYAKNGELKLTIIYQNADKVEATIWKKDDNKYLDTIFHQELNASGEENVFQLNSLDDAGAGSYCLKIIVSKTEGESIRTIMEVPYYFIIMDDESENAS